MIIRKIRDIQAQLKQIDIDIQDYIEELKTCRRKQNKTFFTSAIKNLKNQKEKLQSKLNDINNGR